MRVSDLIPGSLSAMASARGDWQTSLQNLPGWTKGEGEKRDFIYQEESFVQQFICVSQQSVFLGSIFEVLETPSGTEGSSIACSTSGAGEVTAWGQNQAHIYTHKLSPHLHCTSHSSLGA